MAGAYCKFCGQRCFVLRVIPDGPAKGWEGHLATCTKGMAHDREKTGHDHTTDPEAAAAIYGAPRTVYPLGDGWVLEKRP